MSFSRTARRAPHARAEGVSTQVEAFEQRRPVRKNLKRQIRDRGTTITSPNQAKNVRSGQLLTSPVPATNMTFFFAKRSQNVKQLPCA